VRLDGTLALKNEEKRLDLAGSAAAARGSASTNTLKRVQLNLDVKNVNVLEPNWLENRVVLVIVNTGGSTI
jgi:hypothetical protein